jgi:hypothetical protein
MIELVPQDDTGAHTTVPSRQPAPSSRMVALLGGHWPLLAVFAAFIASLFIIPTMANVPVSDDWVYSRSVEILVRNQHLHILDLSVVTLIFQVVWGAIFSILFGTSFGAMRLSTLVIFMLSGWALYGICRELGVSRSRSALGVGAYVFNPLTFVLAFSFMTDPQFLSLLVIATYFYLRGLNLVRNEPWVIVTGSLFASFAFLTRQQGILVPLAVGVYLIAARRWSFNRQGMLDAVRVAGIPAVTFIVYYVWMLGFQGAPKQQSAFLSQMVDAGFRDSRILISRMTYIELAYVGFFVLPIILATIPVLWRATLPQSKFGYAVLAGGVAILVTGLAVFGSRDHLMPYIPQFVGITGLGPTDLVGGRSYLIPRDWSRIITVVVAMSAAAFVVLIARQIGEAFTPERASASLLTCIALWQVVGILPPSYHFRNWIISVDRYLVPLVPFAICLLLWSLRGAKIFQPVGWLAIALFAIFSVTSTRDFLVFQQATWSYAEQAIVDGVPMTRLDAGSSWDGYYLYDYGLENRISQQSPHGPWWTNLFAPATDSTYIIGTSIPEGYVEVSGREYSSWLHRDGQWLWLSRRADYPGPP